MVKLSSTDQAVIPPEKIRDYLLSDSHPVGRLKAAFFRALGYKRKHWEQLERDLRAVLVHEARAVERTAYGQKFEVGGRHGTCSAKRRDREGLDYTER